jgi:hypothetical protein
VSVFVQDPFFIGAMGIVTGAAVRISNNVISVLLFKRRLTRFMTLQTQGRRIRFQQKIRTGGHMRLMTTDTAGFLHHWVVSESSVTDFIAHVVMALITKGIP